MSGDLDLADASLHHAADTLARLGDRNGVGWALGLLAFVRFFQRRFARPRSWRSSSARRRTTAATTGPRR
jgi:hypothetical protein